MRQHRVLMIDVVAPGDRPAGDVVLVLLLDRDGLVGRLEPERPPRPRVPEQGQELARERRPADPRGGDRLEALGDPLPLAPARLRLGREPARAVVEHLGVARIEHERTAVAHRVGDEADVLGQAELPVRVALELLKGDRLAPQERQLGIGAAGELGIAAHVARPVVVGAVRVVPVDDDRLVAGVAIQRDEPGRVRLLAHERDPRAHAEQALVGLEPEAQVPVIDLGRKQRRGALRVRAADQLDATELDQTPRLGQPPRIEPLDLLERPRRRLDADGKRCPLGQPERRPVTALDHMRAALLLDRGEREVQMKHAREQRARHLRAHAATGSGRAAPG